MKFGSFDDHISQLTNSKVFDQIMINVTNLIIEIPVLSIFWGGFGCSPNIKKKK